MIAIATHVTLIAAGPNAAHLMHAYITPFVRTLCVLASLVCVLFLINGGFHYMTCSGQPEKLGHAKLVVKNALLGLVVVFAAAVLTAILSHAYMNGAAPMSERLPSLTTVAAKPVSNGLVDVLIKAITGLLDNIIQSIAAPFLKALAFFTTATPLMAANSSVFNLWLVLVGIGDALFVLVVALLGFHIMSFASFGFDQIAIKHLLPRLTLIFLLMNTSIFAIDGVIGLSNVMIRAVNAGLSTGSVWEVLTKITATANGLGVGALLIMIAFIILSLILLIYYVGRIVTLYIGAVLSPLVLLLWLVPGFRDFAESAAKVYFMTIFVLFVHVVILALAASLFSGISIGSADHTPNTLMGLIVGLATIITLLKTQGVMAQLSYVSVGPRTARQLSSHFMNGISSINRATGIVTKSVGSQRAVHAPSNASSHLSSRSSSSHSHGTPRSAQNVSATSSGQSHAKQTGKTRTATTTGKLKASQNREQS